MKYSLSDNIAVTLTEKGKSVLKLKGLKFEEMPNSNKTWFKIWELRMIFGKRTINLRNSCPIVTNEFFYY